MEEAGVKIFGTDPGELACGDIGLGRMKEPEEIANIIKDFFYLNFIYNYFLMLIGLLLKLFLITYVPYILYIAYQKKNYSSDRVYRRSFLKYN